MLAGTPPPTSANQQSVPNISEALNDTLITKVDVYYFYTLSYGNNPGGGKCNTTQVVPVTVNPIAKIKDKEVNVCSGNYFKLEINDIIPPGTKFTWSLPTIPSGITGQGAQTLAANFNQTLTNSKLVPITLAYTSTNFGIKATVTAN